MTWYPQSHFGTSSIPASGRIKKCGTIEYWTKKVQIIWEHHIHKRMGMFTIADAKFVRNIPFLERQVQLRIAN